jgi:hypothetical protein
LLPGGAEGQLDGGQLVPSHSQYPPLQKHSSLSQPLP